MTTFRFVNDNNDQLTKFLDYVNTAVIIWLLNNSKYVSFDQAKSEICCNWSAGVIKCD